MKYEKDVYVVIAICAIGILLIFGLSWVPNPNLKELTLIPSWITDWTDDYSNSRIRTAIPFILLSLVIGAWFCSKRLSSHSYLWAWLLLTAIVILAEFGQYFIPLRDVDLKDIFWGSFGALFGLGLMYLVDFSLQLLKLR